MRWAIAPSVASTRSARNTGRISAGCSASCWVFATCSAVRRHARGHGARIPLAVGSSRPSPTARKLLARADMDWDAPAIVLDARPYGEGDAIATVMTEPSMARIAAWRAAGGARHRSAVWQRGQPRAGALGRAAGRTARQLQRANWCTRRRRWRWTIRSRWRCCRAACAVAEGALPEREPHPRVFDGLLHLIAHLPQGEAPLDRPDPLGGSAARRSRLRPRSDQLRRHRRDGGPRLRLAEDRPRGHRGGRRGLDIAPAAPAAVPGRRQRGRRRRTGATGCG